MVNSQRTEHFVFPKLANSLLGLFFGSSQRPAL